MRSFAADLLPGLASHIWSSTLFLLAVLAVLFALRGRLTAGARFSLALIGLAKLALPDAVVGAAFRRLTEDALHLGAPQPLAVPLQAFAGALRVDLAPAPARLWPALVLGLWLAVALALLLRLALAHRRLALSARGTLPARPRERAALVRAQQHTGARGPIEIVRTEIPEAPAVLGIRRPRVVLPVAGCDDLSDDELEALLCHECAHVVRRDNLIAVCVSLLCSMFWFHPLAWITRRILMIERERACDEIAAGPAERREIYLTALTKFCHAAIGPGSPVLSRMATSQLKERMDHVMQFADLKTQSPSAARVGLLATAALVLFTAVSGAVGKESSSAQEKGSSPYGVRITATRDAGTVAVAGSVRDNATQTVIASPAVTLDSSRRGHARSSAPGGLEVAFEVRPDTGDTLAVDVTVERSGEPVQKSTLKVIPSDTTAAARPAQPYTGQPINITVTKADLRETITQLASLGGLRVHIDESVRGKVSASWHNVPWDEAFESILNENGLTYRLEGSTVHISKRSAG